jgi:integration host factor subunit beta
MTKAELVARVATQTQLPTSQAAAIVEGFLQCLMEALRSGDTVELREFGSFRCRPRRPRTGRNPKTGVAVPVPAKMRPFFKASQAVHARLNPLEPVSHRCEGRGKVEQRG